MKLFQDLRECLDAVKGAHDNAHLGLHAAGNSPRLGLKVITACDDRPDTSKEDLTCRCQGQPLPGAVEEHNAQLLLQLADRLAPNGLHPPQPLYGGCEAPSLGDGDHHAELIKGDGPSAYCPL